MRDILPLFLITIAMLLVTLVMTGCVKDPAERHVIQGTEFTVDRLFTHEGCTLYRFRDGDSHHIYYANCGASTFHQQSCGKGCSRPVLVTAGYENQNSGW